MAGVGGQYTLGAFQVTGGSEVRIMRKGAGTGGGDKMVGKPLAATDFTTDAAKMHLADLRMKAEQLRKAAELPNKKATVTADRNRFANLKTLQDQVEAARQLLIADVIAQACTLLGAGCFAAGTKLWTPGGYRNIEEIKAGEAVYSRDQWDAGGDVSAKVVEEVFERYAGVLHVHVGGQVIRTTHEHPFFVHGKGWTMARELRANDRLLCADGTTVSVEEVFDTGEWELVYNLRVAEYHTYFVGDEAWGWSAWAHNAYLEKVSRVRFDTTQDRLVQVTAEYRRSRTQDTNTPISGGKNVAVVKVHTPTGAEEYWTAGSGDNFVRVYSFSGVNLVSVRTDVVTPYYLQHMYTRRIRTSPSGGHSEEVLIGYLNQRSVAAQNAKQPKFELLDFYTEYAPCAQSPGCHSCSVWLNEWSRDPQVVSRVDVQNDVIKYTQFYPGAATVRPIHRPWHIKVAQAANRGAVANALLEDNHYQDVIIPARPAADITPLGTPTPLNQIGLRG